MEVAGEAIRGDREIEHVEWQAAFLSSSCLLTLNCSPRCAILVRIFKCKIKPAMWIPSVEYVVCSRLLTKLETQIKLKPL